MIVWFVLLAAADHSCEGDCARFRAKVIERALKEAPVQAITAAPWDKHATPQHHDLITKRFPFSAEESARLSANGFFASSRVEATNYVAAFHAIHAADLPVYVSADAIFHAVYVAHSSVIDALETEILVPQLRSILERMKKHTGRNKDAALYLSMARVLLDAEWTNNDELPEEQKALLDAVLNAEGLREVELFGRKRAIDFGQFRPRAHYAATETMRGYFRAVAWLSLVTLNLQSRDCQSGWITEPPNTAETPREIELAIALTTIAKNAGVLPDLRRFDDVLARLAGRREDLGPLELSTMTVKQIGTRFARTLAYEPVLAVKRLPVVFTLLGQRITADNAALFNADNFSVTTIADVLSRLDRSRTATDVYDRWLSAILAARTLGKGAVPSFTQTKAFADLTLNTTLVAYGQLRHNYVLYVGQPYRVSGCLIGDGYVEPRLEMYDALIEYTTALIAAAKVFRMPKAGRSSECNSEDGGSCDPAEHIKGHIGRLQHVLTVLRVLRRIAEDELASRPLTKTQHEFLAMIVSLNGFDPTYSGDGPPKFDGWYPDMLGEAGTTTTASFIIDIATTVSDKGHAVHYLGAGPPRLAFFVVDTGGPPRLMVGPIANGYGVRDTSGGPRFTDEDNASNKMAPWSGSYVVESNDEKEQIGLPQGRNNRRPPKP